MTIRLIGDVHGKFAQYKTIIKNGPSSIQVGDMGVGFRRTLDGINGNAGEFSANPPYDLMAARDARFIRGNHDNPAVCDSHTQCISDGSIECGVMFVGGAQSVDRSWRTEGYDWWPDEELSVAELNDMVDLYIEAKPRVMITHDCPEEVAEAMEAHSGRKKLDFKSRTRQAFQAMWSAHSPELWVYGHWHYSFDHVLRGTRFVCLAELEYRDDLISADEMPSSWKSAA